MKMINDVKIGDQVEMLLKIQNLQFKKTPSNQEYASMVGYDCKEYIDVKMWKLSQDEKDILENGKIYIFKGVVKDYQGKKQLNVDTISEVNENEVAIDDFYERAPLSMESLQKEISSYIIKIKNPILKQIVLTVVKKYQFAYFEYPAAVSIHHNYISGLAYHVYSMLKLSGQYLENYSYLNRDLVYAGIILHDIGKVKELSGSKAVSYTKEGNLLGHITIGQNILHEICTELRFEGTEEALMLEHIILSHHGKLEYGSPKEPSIPEAALIFLLDYADSRFASLKRSVDEIEKGKYTDPVIAFDKRSFYVPNID